MGRRWRLASALFSVEKTKVDKRDCNRFSTLPLFSFFRAEFSAKEFPAKEFPAEGFPAREFPAKTFPAEELSAPSFSANASLSSADWLVLMCLLPMLILPLLFPLFSREFPAGFDVIFSPVNVFNGFSLFFE